MASPLQHINLIAPGFKGINTEDSPLAQDQSFAEVADNAVIDQRGRIAARKGYTLTTAVATPLGSDRIHRIHEFYSFDGTGDVTFSTGNNKIFTGEATLTDVTPAAYIISNNNWKIVNFNNRCYFFQRGQEPLVYYNAGSTASPDWRLVTFGTFNSNTTSSTLYCNEALAAFGRLWVVGSGDEANVIYWSDLLVGTNFTTGSSGSVDVTLVWPDGYDEVRALAAHNNLLIVFGNHSIIVYQGADSPANMTLADTVAGVGVECRNSVQHIGTDVLFVSEEGLRSFGRTIQEKSMPLSDLSRNIKSELLEQIANRTEPTTTAYSPENSFYLLCFPDLQLIYCFDIRGTVENGAYRVTRWPSSALKALHRKQDGTLLVGTTAGIGKYTGYSDNGSLYQLVYRSPSLAFGDSSRLKMLKKIKATLVGGVGATATVSWEYDFSGKSGTAQLTIEGGSVAYYGESEYGIAEYSSGITVDRKSINASGSGEVVNIGLTMPINGAEVSIQELNVLATLGKIQ